MRPAAELRRLRVDLPGVGQAAAGEVEEAAEQLRGAGAGEAVALQQDDPVAALRQLQLADVVVVQDPEGAGAEAAVVRMATAASTATTTTPPFRFTAKPTPGDLTKARLPALIRYP